MPNEVTRYSSVAIWLHWIIALLIIGMMAAGIWMAAAIKVKETQALAFEVYQLHKSFGLTILFLSIFRLYWRLTHVSPELPKGMAVWERVAAHLTHWMFYALMLGLPISGWLMVSSSPLGLPTLYFNSLEVPHAAALSSLDPASKMVWEGRFKDIHQLMAYGGIGLITLHIGAALKHHFWSRDAILFRMVPFLEKLNINKEL